MSSTIEQKIRDRAYQSPSRARAAVSRSHLGKKDQERLGVLIDRWENEGTVDHVVAGVPEAPAVELVDAAVVNGVADAASLSTLELSRPAVGRLNLNAAVRVRLTLHGLTLLHEARHRMNVPGDLIARQGVWETTLWELMSAFGAKLATGEEPVEGCLIEVLDPKAPSIKAPSIKAPS